MRYLRPLIPLLFLYATACGTLFASSDQLARINAKYDALERACIERLERDIPAWSAAFNRAYCADYYAMGRNTETNYETMGPLFRWTQDHMVHGSGFSYTFIAK
jgi:hypothetical protein